VFLNKLDKKALKFVNIKKNIPFFFRIFDAKETKGSTRKTFKRLDEWRKVKENQLK
jgi:hypothetical protein